MKTFFMKDKSGRGYSAAVFIEDILEMENETDRNDEELHEFAKYAEVGQNWETAALEVICIKN